MARERESENNGPWNPREKEMILFCADRFVDIHFRLVVATDRHSAGMRVDVDFVKREE